MREAADEILEKGIVEFRCPGIPQSLGQPGLHKARPGKTRKNDQTVGICHRRFYGISGIREQDVLLPPEPLLEGQSPSGEPS